MLADQQHVLITWILQLNMISCGHEILAGLDSQPSQLQRELGSLHGWVSKLTWWLSFYAAFHHGIFAMQRECVTRKKRFMPAPRSFRCPLSLQSSGEARLLSWTCLSGQVKWLVHPLWQAWFTLNRNVGLHEWYLKTPSFPKRGNKLMDLREER